jgi:hypothetical protein
VYIFPTRFVLGRLGSSLAAMWHQREPLLCIDSGGLVVINDVVFDGGFVCSRTLEGICERSILLHFSFLFGGSGRFSDAVFRELWRLVSFALGGGTFDPLPCACFGSLDFVPVAGSIPGIGLIRGCVPIL